MMKRIKAMHPFGATWKAIPVLVLAAMTLLSACGKNTFTKQVESTTALAGQYIYIKPKLDLVVFQDDSDSMYKIGRAHV